MSNQYDLPPLTAPPKSVIRFSEAIKAASFCFAVGLKTIELLELSKL
jgi:hypothetical protein